MTDQINEVLDKERALSVKLQRYPQKWVAIKEYEVVYQASTFDELLSLLNEEEKDNVRVQYVSAPGMISIYTSMKDNTPELLSLNHPETLN
jgi:hypothetical protein